MNRRGFFKLFGLGVAGIALEQAIPLGRVWSFPKNILVGPGAVTQVKFIMVWDPARAIQLNRFDTLYGFGNSYEGDNRKLLLGVD